MRKNIEPGRRCGHMVRPEEAFNFYSHLVGMVAAVIGTIFLASRAAESASMMVAALVYGLSVVFLFSASVLYHAFKKHDDELSFWRRMDRLAIFIMIAGSYTPICHLFLDGTWESGMIAIQWALVAFGLISQLWFPRAPRRVFAAIYLAMGWLALLPMGRLLAAMSVPQTVLMFAGGAAFTAGAVFYSTKRPAVVPGVFSFHELFHVMVLIGAACHYALIYDAVANASLT